MLRFIKLCSVRSKQRFSYLFQNARTGAIQCNNKAKDSGQSNGYTVIFLYRKLDQMGLLSDPSGIFHMFLAMNIIWTVCILPSTGKDTVFVFHSHLGNWLQQDESVK